MLALTPFRALPRPIQIILILNAAIFLPAVVLALFRAADTFGFVSQLVLIPSQYLEVWRFVTYAFVHTNPIHFLFNMLLFWMFSEDVAEWLGNRAFWLLYLGSAIFAGLFSVPFYLSDVIASSVYILGASGALFGVMVAYAWLFPERQMLLFMIFPVKARTAVAIFVGIDILMVNSGDGVAHYTHLGGVLAGLAFMYLRSGPLARLQWKLRKRQYTSPVKALQGEVGYLDEQKQLDTLLAKISRSGMGSLTPEEVDSLKQASEKARLRRGL